MSPTTIRSRGASPRRCTPPAQRSASARSRCSSTSASGRWPRASASTFVEPCDVQNDADIERVFERWQQEQGRLDILVHALAFAKREELDGRFVDTSRDGFALALDVSAYSLVALARAAAPLMPSGGSIMTLSYYGAEKVVAELQRHGRGQGRARGAACATSPPTSGRTASASTRSAPGPIRTLAASGVAGFKTMYGKFRDVAPLRRNVTIDDVGATAVYLRQRPVGGRHRRDALRRCRLQHPRGAHGRGVA